MAIAVNVQNSEIKIEKIRKIIVYIVNNTNYKIFFEITWYTKQELNTNQEQKILYKSLERYSLY